MTTNEKIILTLEKKTRKARKKIKEINNSNNTAVEILRGSIKLLDAKITDGIIGKAHNEFMEKSIYTYLKCLNLKDEEDILDFLNSLDEKEKAFFIETIKKIINLNEEIKIYILAQLTKIFNQNGELSYYQKIFFNAINNFIEDDFFIFYDFYKGLEKPINYKFVLNASGIPVSYYGVENNVDKMALILSKFEAIGLISTKMGSFPPNVFFNIENAKNIYVFFTFKNNFIEEIFQWVEDFKALNDKKY